MAWYALIITWPYFRSYRQYTLIPIQRIRRASNEAQKRHAIRVWRRGKKEELTFIGAASTICAGANIGVFSWPDIPTAYWLARSFLYTSLALSCATVILAAQHRAIVFMLPEVHTVGTDGLTKLTTIVTSLENGSLDEESSGGGENGLEKPPFPSRWMWRNNLFVWQCPLMLMAWGWMTFVLGLTIHIVTPLFDRNDSSQGYVVAILFLTVAVLSIVLFIWTSFWTYLASGVIHEIEEDREWRMKCRPRQSASIAKRKRWRARRM